MCSGNGWGWRNSHCHEPSFLELVLETLAERAEPFRVGVRALSLPGPLPSLRARMRISIFGLGYVGAVTAGCLARQGHSIVGVDVHPQKVEAFNQGVPPIVEPGLDDLLKAAKVKGLLRATLSCEEAIAETEVSIVCVGTRSRPPTGSDPRRRRRAPSDSTDRADRADRDRGDRADRDRGDEGGTCADRCRPRGG